MHVGRVSGILLHPTSLPGPWGMGELGPEAFRFVDDLAAAGQGLWQVLPLGPTGYGDSPYQCFSAFAGNPLLISLDVLREQGLLREEDVADAPDFPAHEVDYGRLIDFKYPVLTAAWRRFRETADAGWRRVFDDFCRAESAWLDDFALFMVVKGAHGGRSWTEWPADIRSRQPRAVDGWRHDHEDAVRCQMFWQFLFFSQWRAVHQAARARGIRVMGDIPIFVAHDSADVWAHPDLFQLADDGRPEVVAGVPPDYFSATGQLWGNPIYRWDEMERRGFDWWTARFRASLHVVDVVRVDHFRGFEAYWEIPGGAPTAMHGRWVKAPGERLFESLRASLGELPIVAENLGVITPEVEALRERFGFPGMAILQFAFGSDPQGNTFIPHNYPRERVVYTGTHDNDTTVGWWTSAPGGDSTRSAEEIERERHFARRYLQTDGREIHWDLIRAALASVAGLAIVPLQDVLGLGTEARMNVPGRPGGNWRWRLRPGQLTPQIQARLRELTTIYGRTPSPAA